MKLRKVVQEGGRSPFGYGFAWDDPMIASCWRFVYYPIGIHWVARFLRWMQIQAWRPGRMAIEIRKGYYGGLNVGREEGVRHGREQYDEGFNAGRESAFEQLKEMVGKDSLESYFLPEG